MRTPNATPRSPGAPPWNRAGSGRSAAPNRRPGPPSRQRFHPGNAILHTARRRRCSRRPCSPPPGTARPRPSRPGRGRSSLQSCPRCSSFRSPNPDDSEEQEGGGESLDSRSGAIYRNTLIPSAAIDRGERFRRRWVVKLKLVIPLHCTRHRLAKRANTSPKRQREGLPGDPVAGAPGW